ncbi:Secretory immunoglobulin A-binding protein EsiB [Pseudomonas fluorescens]|uniref:Secretory immunoglobulin A-binding protein EsiB n=1 Tax=Pseudomonas fluorescens TaxID=294 RepID=A0A5E7DVW1_PSEFL|nr:tetratricopeptide repeat protein [Pseudomonas fluorescens]VVO20821.1 Secretory immunoglobulin A-binding protein EsiB [Pseudomonas fluorescens]
MSFQLRRQEVLDGEQLSAMLEESPARAAQAILLAAGEGEVEAQALLGQILLDGRGIAQDQVLALRWFGIAAGQGHLMARNMLGRCHEHGWGCAADASVAAQHYRIAAEAGLDWAMYNLANLLATGRGLAEDHVQALALYQRAADLGHAKSMNLLGRYLEEGQMCPADKLAAREWYRRSAEGGDFRGQFSYAAVLADEGNVDEAILWLEKALAGGNLNFLRVASQTLASATDPRLQAMANQYSQRYAQSL